MTTTITLTEPLFRAIEERARSVGWKVDDYVELCLTPDYLPYLPDTSPPPSKVEEPQSCSLPWLEQDQRGALERTLEDRLEGPFVPLADDFVEKVMAKAMERVAERRRAENA